MSDKANLVQWIEKAAKGEPIEAVVIGEMGGSGDWGSDDVPGYSEQPRGKVLSWADARPWLDYQFCDGFGSAGCNAIYVWTGTRIIFISEYDGSTSVRTIPRNPIDCLPEMG